MDATDAAAISSSYIPYTPPAYCTVETLSVRARRARARHCAWLSPTAYTCTCGEGGGEGGGAGCGGGKGGDDGDGGEGVAEARATAAATAVAK